MHRRSMSLAYINEHFHLKVLHEYCTRTYAIMIFIYAIVFHKSAATKENYLSQYRFTVNILSILLYLIF